MAKPPPRDYLKVLAELDADHAAGKVTDAQYEFYKTRLINEANQKKRPASVTFLIVVGVIVAALILLRIVGLVFNSIVGG